MLTPATGRMFNSCLKGVPPCECGAAIYRGKQPTENHMKINTTVTRTHTATISAAEIEDALTPMLRRERPDMRIIAGSLRPDESKEGSFIIGVEPSSTGLSAKGPGRPRKSAPAAKPAISKAAAAPKKAEPKKSVGWPKGKPRGPKKPKAEPANPVDAPAGEAPEPVNGVASDATQLPVGDDISQIPQVESVEAA